MRLEWLGATAAVVAVALWVVKDLLLYPLLRSSYEKGPDGLAALIGCTAIAVESFEGCGFVRVRGELWRARCSVGVDAGQALHIVAAEKGELRVEPVESVASGA